MTYSDMLSQLDFFILYFWAIAFINFRPLEIYKNLGLPLSTVTLLLPTATQITISICIFVSVVIQREITFFIKIYAKVFQIWFQCKTQLLFF